MKELVILVGLPAAGKSTIVEEYITKGYHIISRDILGGTLENVNKILFNDIKLFDKIILDNTYMTKESRKEVISIGKQNSFKVTCIHLNTSVEDAQFNAVTRMIKTQGKLLNTDEYKSVKDPHIFPPAALFKANKIFEAPDENEGFDEIKIIKFKRNSNGYTNKALLLDYDGTLRITINGNDKYPTHKDQIQILPNRVEKLKEYQDKGYILLGVSNQSGVSKGILTYDEAKKCFDHTNKLLGLDIDVSFCPHSVPPIVCYCRKPGVGLGVEFIEKYKLDPLQCIMVGDLTSDKTFATRCGFKFIHTDKFFV